MDYKLLIIYVIKLILYINAKYTF